MTKVLWFSRHTMTEEQVNALVQKFGDIEVTQVNGEPANVHVEFEGEVNGESVGTLPPLKEMVSNFDVAAVVLPIGMQQQILPFGNKAGVPVIQALNKRTLVPNANGGEDKVVFNFEKWQRIEKVEVVLSDF